MQNTLATIGYERADLADFVATLTASNIQVLVDIRDRAQSRRAGFSKNALSEVLSEHNIEYLHLRELGDPKEGREAARSGDYEKFVSIYSQVLKSEEAKNALSEIETLLGMKNICLMCFERDQSTCHRKMVSDHLEKNLKMKATHLGVRQGLGRQSKA